MAKSHHNLLNGQLRRSIDGYAEDFNYVKNLSSSTSKASSLASTSSSSSTATLVPAASYVPTTVNSYHNNYNSYHHHQNSSSPIYPSQQRTIHHPLSPSANFDNQHFLDY